MLNDQIFIYIIMQQLKNKIKQIKLKTQNFLTIKQNNTNFANETTKHFEYAKHQLRIYRINIFIKNLINKQKHYNRYSFFIF